MGVSEILGMIFIIYKAESWKDYSGARVLNGLEQK
jgi:hypothetical protein